MNRAAALKVLQASLTPLSTAEIAAQARETRHDTYGVLRDLLKAGIVQRSKGGNLRAVMPVKGVRWRIKPGVDVTPYLTPS